MPGQIREPALIAISAPRMHALPAHSKRHLAQLVAQGAVLYVRGLPCSGGLLELSPFAPDDATIAPEPCAIGYRFTTSPRLPTALRGEQTMGGTLATRGAQHLPRDAEQLLMLRHAGGEESTGIFALRHGQGVAIYDLHPDSEDCADLPLVERLADPELRRREIGALVAADCATLRDARPLPAFNLTIDDRPVNFDHFNTSAVSALLRHIEELCPGSHTDFAWTPRHTSPSRGYLEVMKQFPTGFVWHGLYRHVDHRVIADPFSEFARGRRLVCEIEQRFGIRLQPVMIFPFERTAAEQFRLLLEAGFLASVEEPGLPRSFKAGLPRHLEFSLPAVIDPRCGFTVVYRYRMVTLTRDRMLAMAALGLPIIAYAHPDELGLRRFSRLWDRKGDVSHFDPVLKFASSKGLPSRSLEEIAAEIKATRAARAA